MKTRDKKKFIKTMSRRFNLEQWQELCAKTEFLEALETGNADLVEVVAWKLINPTQP